MQSRASVHKTESGQVVIASLLIIVVFIFLLAALVDGYALFEARDWGYQTAQQAALAGSSIGRDWAGSTKAPGGCIGPAAVELDADTARNAALNFLNSEMALRGMSGYSYDIRVLPDYDGGTVSGYPPQPVRLGASRGSWSSDEPSIGVYLSFPVSTFLMSMVGRPTVQLHVFASASVGQPVGVCPP
jgi:hypothetical protein